MKKNWVFASIIMTMFFFIVIKPAQAQTLEEVVCPTSEKGWKCYIIDTKKFAWQADFPIMGVYIDEKFYYEDTHIEGLAITGIGSLEVFVISKNNIVHVFGYFSKPPTPTVTPTIVPTATTTPTIVPTPTPTTTVTETLSVPKPIVLIIIGISVVILAIALLIARIARKK